MNDRSFSDMIRVDARSAAAAASASSPRSSTPPRELSPLARAVAAAPIPPAISPVVVAGVVRITELVCIAVIGTLIYCAYLFPQDGFSWHYVLATVGLSMAAIVAFEMFEIYDVTAFRTHIYQLSRLTAAWTLVFLIAMAITFFGKFEGTFSRVWAAAWYVIGLSGLLSGRLALTALVRYWARTGRLVRRVIIVGGGREGEALVDALESEADSDLRICGVFDDRNDDRSPPVVGGVPKLGTVDDLIEFTRRTRVDLILVSLPLTAEDRVLTMVRKLWVLPVDVRLAAHMSKLRFRPRAYSYIGNVPVLDIFDKPITDWDLVVKTLFDRVVGTLMVIALAPMMAAVALAVRFDSPGPVLFRQRRYGFNNELVEVFKFRSMYANQSDAAAAKLVTKGDPRVTRVGRFIRKTSLDELPQLFNVVLTGNLSLVGPRPHAMQAKAEQRLYEEAVDGYFARHRVKPGITGWAQINGFRGETDTDEKMKRRVEHDLYYIDNWSPWLDLQILVRTVLSARSYRNAY